MRVSDENIGTLGIMMMDIEEGIRVDLGISIPLIRERIGVEVLVLEQEDHTELVLSHRNATKKDLHAEKGEPIQGRHLRELMMNTS